MVLKNFSFRFEKWSEFCATVLLHETNVVRFYSIAAIAPSMDKTYMRQIARTAGVALSMGTGKLVLCGENILGKKWQLDVRVGRTLLIGAFRLDEIVCTKTLYNYITKNFLKPIKSIDLPERTKRKQRHRHFAQDPRSDGHGIDDRDPAMMTRTTFCHWKTDLMLCGRDGKEVLLAVAERKTLYPCLCKVKDKSTVRSWRRCAPSDKRSAHRSKCFLRQLRGIMERMFHDFPNAIQQWLRNLTCKN